MNQILGGLNNEDKKKKNHLKKENKEKNIEENKEKINEVFNQENNQENNQELNLNNTKITENQNNQNQILNFENNINENIENDVNQTSSDFNLEDFFANDKKEQNLNNNINENLNYQNNHNLNNNQEQNKNSIEDEINNNLKLDLNINEIEKEIETQTQNLNQNQNQNKSNSGVSQILNFGSDEDIEDEDIENEDNFENNIEDQNNIELENINFNELENDSNNFNSDNFNSDNFNSDNNFNNNFENDNQNNIENIQDEVNNNFSNNFNDNFNNNFQNQEDLNNFDNKNNQENQEFTTQQNIEDSFNKEFSNNNNFESNNFNYDSNNNFENQIQNNNFYENDFPENIENHYGNTNTNVNKILNSNLDGLENQAMSQAEYQQMYENEMAIKKPFKNKLSEKTIIIVFAVILVLFALVIGYFGIKFVNENSKNKSDIGSENIKPIISVIPNQDGNILNIDISHPLNIQQIIYTWNEDTANEKTISDILSTEYTLTIDIPFGDNLFTIRAEDVNGNVETFEDSYSNEIGLDIEKPKVNIQQSAGNQGIVRVDVTDNNQISSIRYRWNSEQYQNHEITNNGMEQQSFNVQVPEGKNDLYVIATDAEGNVTEERKPFDLLTNPTLHFEIVTDTTEMTEVLVQFKHESGIEKIEYTLNGTPYAKDYSDRAIYPVEDIIYVEVIEEGENILDVTVTPVEGRVLKESRKITRQIPTNNSGYNDPYGNTN